MSLISCENIDVVFDGKKILDNVSVDVTKDDLITIVGPNGAGKTTLLKILLGLQNPTSGKVTRQKNVRIGYVPQKMSPEGMMPMTVHDFLNLGHKPNLDLLEQTVDEVKIGDLLGSSLVSLSGGEVRRVLLARALMQQPQLLLLDEPDQNLDVGGQLSLYKLLEKIHKTRQCGIMMVSHHLYMVMAHSTQVLCLYHHLCCQGTPQSVAEDPVFLDMFGKETARMMGYYKHHHDHDHKHEHHDGE